MLDRFNIGPNDTHVGLVQYNTEPRLVFSLNSHVSKDQLITEVKRVPYIKGETSTGKAIQFASETVFSTQNVNYSLYFLSQKN